MPMPPRLSEPFRVKTVEPIAITTRHERRHYLEQANYNLFAIPADRVTIDLEDSSDSYPRVRAGKIMDEDVIRVEEALLP